MDFNRVKYITNYALINNEYYKNKHSKTKIERLDDFEKLSFLSKSELQSKDLLTYDYHKFPFNQHLKICHTSGTTGECVKIAWSFDDYMKSMMSTVFFRKFYYNISPDDHYLTFFSTNYSKNKIVENKDYYLWNNNLAINKQVIHTLKDSELNHVIEKFSPKWLLVQPSVLMLLDELNLDWMYGLNYIETTGEILLTSQREYIKSKYNVAIVNHYGAIETNYIAHECPYGNKHINDDNVYVELNNVDDKSRIGDIIVTSLHNKATPILRYKIGDRGGIRLSDCPCGNTSAIIDFNGGRDADYILKANGTKVSWYPILNSIERLNEQLGDPIIKVKIIQQSFNRITIKIKLQSNFISWRNSIIARLLDLLNELSYIDGFSFEVTILDDIKKPLGEKDKVFINLIKESKADEQYT